MEPDVFEITITRIRTKTVRQRGEYGVIEKRPYTDDELREANSRFIEAYSKAPDAFTVKEVMGYRPDVDKTVEEKNEIYRQRSEGVNLKEVIKAVNAIV